MHSEAYTYEDGCIYGVSEGTYDFTYDMNLKEFTNTGGEHDPADENKYCRSIQTKSCICMESIFEQLLMKNIN